MHKPYCHTHGAQLTWKWNLGKVTQKTRVECLFFSIPGYWILDTVLKLIYYFSFEMRFVRHSNIFPRSFFSHIFFILLYFVFAPQIKCSHLSFCSITRCAVNKLMLFVCLSSMVLFHCSHVKNAQHRWKMM